jgi:hypothetical protein
MQIFRLATLPICIALATACASVPKAQYNVAATMPLAVTPDPVVATSGVVKAGDTIARHKVRALGGAILGAEVVGITRTVPAGSMLAQGMARDKAGVLTIFCDVRPVDAFSTSGETDCFQDADKDGKFDTAWTGRPSISLFTMSLSLAGFHGPIPPAPYELAKPEDAPATEVGFHTYVCWNGKPAFVFGIRQMDGDWDFGTGPCGPGSHPGEVAADGVFRSMGAGIKVTEAGGQSAYEVIERIPPGPISLGTRRLN